MNVFKNLANCLPPLIFEYETSKVVQIRSLKIGIIYRLSQVGIIFYIAIWVMYHDKGYQVFDYPVAGVTAKVKGVSFRNLSKIGPHVWDVADFIIPPQQNSAFFVSTNMIITPNQTLSMCPESTDIPGSNCTTDSDCLMSDHIQIGNGIRTGKCVNSDKINNTKVCEIFGWCPTEKDEMLIPGEPLLNSAPNFTVLLKNSIEFPKFKVKRRNILSWMDKDFLDSCQYDPSHPKNKFCPIFKLRDIVHFSNTKNKNIWTHGALFSIHIDWNCNLDLNYEKCVPEYTFRHLDDFEFDLGKGWNFRYSHHYVENKKEKRTLIKTYGIQCFITVSGRGGKFNPFTFSMNLGSGLALLGISSLLCDLVVLNLVRKRDFYKKAKTDKFQKEMYYHSSTYHTDQSVVHLNKNINKTDSYSEREIPSLNFSKESFNCPFQNNQNRVIKEKRISRSVDCIINNRHFSYSSETY